MITCREWVEYFVKLYSGNTGICDIQYAEPYLYNEYLDKPFMTEELRIVLHKAKYGKAPGLDRIPAEF